MVRVTKINNLILYLVSFRNVFEDLFWQCELVTLILWVIPGSLNKHFMFT